MEDLEALCRWLKTYPGWESDSFYVDYTDGTPGNSGLFPLGMEEISRKEDVLGNVTVQCRYHFSLRHVAVRQEDGGENARWLLQFQQWVQSQCAAGTAPRFGDEPTAEHIRAEKGKLSKISQPGAGVYEVTLIAEFIKYFEVI